jgi:hypothetical protein
MGCIYRENVSLGVWQRLKWYKWVTKWLFVGIWDGSRAAAAGLGFDPKAGSINRQKRSTKVLKLSLIADTALRLAWEGLVVCKSCPQYRFLFRHIRDL